MRIVSLAPSNTEILFELGLDKQIVATTSLCDYPDQAMDKKSVGGWNQGLDIEKVVEIDPDLAFASDDLQDKLTDRLRDRGIEVIHLKPHTIEEVFQSIEKVGEAVDRTSEAQSIVSEMRSELDDIGLKDKPRIYCEEWMEPPIVSGNWIPGLIDFIGGQYFIEEAERSKEPGLKDLKSFDPEYIFLNVCGAGENIDTSKVIQRDRWKGITAVQNRQVHVIDDALLNRPGPRLVDGAKKIAQIINNS